MIHHPNKQQNILMQDKSHRRWWRKLKAMAMAVEPYRPVTSTTYRPGRKVSCWNGDGDKLYISVPTRFVMTRLFSWVKCPCDNCVRERENPRLRKERPAKDVEAAKLREFKRKKEAAHE